MLILTMPTFVSNAPLIIDYFSNCFQSRIIRYNYFLERNFNGAGNQTSPLAHIYLPLQSNNETYTLKKMLQ